MSADNFLLEIRSEGINHFSAAFKLAWSNVPGGIVTHCLTPIPARSCGCFRGTKSVTVEGETRRVLCGSCAGTGEIKPHEGLVLLWHEEMLSGVAAQKLVFDMNLDAAIGFCWSWLHTAKYPKEPDIDGSVGRGFLVTTGHYWGHVEGLRYGCIGVYPEWLLYGK